MQAVYSTGTDVKIHQAIRREWTSFQAWLFQQHRRLQHREHEILAAAHRKWGKMKNPEKQEIHGLQEEFLAVARGEWLARVRHSQLHLEHWVMTPDEKQALLQTLGWTQKEMVDAYARQQAEMGSMYQRVDPSTLGTKEPPPDPTSRFMHPRVHEDQPAYAKWGAELAKTSVASPHRAPRSIKSVKSAEVPSMPLYFVGALLQGTDLDAVAASHLEAFAVHVSEEKIREYYAEACEASLHFQRLLPTLDPSQREAAQAGFELHMRELASAKERDWKAITVKELRKHQAAEMEKRVAQQRAMRPSPRKELRRHFRDWDYLDDHPSPQRDYLHDYHSPRREHLEAYHSPRQDSFEEYRSPQQRDYFDEYQGPQRDYLDEYQNSQPDSYMESYHSPQPPRRAKRRPMPEEKYAVTRGRIQHSTARNSLQHPGSKPTMARSPGNWASIRVDEVDLKKPRTRTARNTNDFELRLDGAASTRRPSTGNKLKKRAMETVDPKQAKAATTKSISRPVAGPTYRRRVPNAEGNVPMEILGAKETGEAEAQSDQLRHRLGRPGFRVGLLRHPLGEGGKQAKSRNERRVERRQPTNMLKRVRFAPGVISSGSLANIKHAAAFLKPKVNETQSKFYESFGSRANSAAS